MLALRSVKARRGLRGRSSWREQLAGSEKPSGAFHLHIHAASVGEFEQAKPLMEVLRQEGGVCWITASFFSPSGYEQQKDAPGLDGACYLP